MKRPVKPISGQRIIRVVSRGEDAWGRKVFENIETKRIYKLIDGKYHTASKDGEPCCPIRNDIKVIVVQEQVPFKIEKEPVKKIIEVEGIKIAVPTITKETMIMEPVYRKIFNALKNKTNWKESPTPFVTTSEAEASMVSNAFDFFLGGSEIDFDDEKYTVTSKGYYHYVGA